MYSRFNHLYHRLTLFFVFVMLGSFIGIQAQSPFPEGTKRILFLGNSITYAGTYVTDIESYFIANDPKHHYEFINIGLPSETVSGLSEEGHAGGQFPRPDLHERLSRVLALVKPDVVFACYGMNDGIYQPFDEGRFAAFRNGIHWLHSELEEAGVKKIIHLTPPVHDDGQKGTQGYNLVLDKYATWLLAQRDSLKWEVGDIHFPMTKYLDDRRKTEPGFKLADDGVHPGDLGHWLMAKAVLLYLGQNKVASAPDIATALKDHPYGAEILSLAGERQSLMKDAWLSATKHKRPGMNTGVPLEEARVRYDVIEKRIQALVKGKALARVRIACIGNSITEGYGVQYRETESYPSQLQTLLGYDYEVLNFGVSSKTAIKSSDNSYMATGKYQEALKSSPDIVMIKLGTNDSRMPYRANIAAQFIPDYKTLVHSFQALPSHPRIILLLPVASWLTDTVKQTDKAIKELVIPRIQQIAYEEKLELVDLHAITVDKEALFPDKLHPDAAGATIIAKRLCEAVANKTTRDFDIFPTLPQPYTVSSFYGYDCADFTFQGRNAKIVKPRVVATGRPWVWRARFWGHEPQTDIALLDRGFHIVYCDASELFGNVAAVALWNGFYQYLHKAGLASKAVMEGMSRGGVYVYNWAAQHPKKVACVYADAPVLDLKSWPGGKGAGKGSAGDWEVFKKDYGYTTEEATVAFKNSPLDKVAAIVKGKYPMLHVVGDADDVVPVAENTTLFEQRVKALGGNIQVIHKPGVGHHPHSLPDPQPIVDFVLNACK